MTSEGALYGQSLFDLATEENLTDQLLPQLEMIRQIFAENPDYIKLLSEPSIPRNERLKLLDDAMRGQVHIYLLNLLKILLENDLLRDFGACVKQFRASYYEANGIAEAVVTSAVALTGEQAAQLTAKLVRITGKKIILTQKVDASVLGGLRVETDGRLMDGTVTGRLDEIRKKVNNVII